MSLLKKLNTALSKVYGNSLLAEESEYDEFFCTVCKERVSEDRYNHKHRCCYSCWYSESDHTRYDDGDAPNKEE